MAAGAIGLRELYSILQGQIRRHDAVLEAMRALARATLTVSAVVLGAMAVSLGNLVVFVQEGYPHGLLPHAAAAVIALAVAGLVGIVASVVLSVRAVSVTRVRQPISRNDFGAGGSCAVEGMLESTEEEVYGSLVEGCVDSLEDREKAIDRVGFRTSWAQVFLLGGLVVASAGITFALALVASGLGPG